MSSSIHSLTRLSKSALAMLCLSFSVSACARNPVPTTASNTPQPSASPLASATPNSHSEPGLAVLPADISAEPKAAEEAEEDCQVAQTASRRFLPRTSVPPIDRILPATENDCGFYNWGWQTFLFATQLGSNRQPTFLNYSSFESVFDLSETELLSKFSTTDSDLYNARRFRVNALASASRLPLLNGGFKQAGEAGAMLIDQNRNAVFYSIHINPNFAEFVEQNQLNNLPKLLQESNGGGVPTDLEFPPGALELKAAWKIVEPGEDVSRYFTRRARVPLLKNAGQQVIATGGSREVNLALIGLHVVGVVQDHPEFIWATFEHVDALGRRDLAPAAKTNPLSGTAQELETLLQKYPLFGLATPVSLANQQPAQHTVEARSQKFQAATSVFRVFPASLSKQAEEDQALKTLNAHMGELFASSDPSGQDLRRNYRMVGAVWIDQPGSKDPNGVFKANRSFENTPEHTLLAGEDALSSMAMESFTQQSAPNCFSCHNTTRKMILPDQFFPARRINVSNALTFFAQAKLLGNAP